MIKEKLSFSTILIYKNSFARLNQIFKDLLPFHFTESGIENTTVVPEGILEYLIPCKDVEEGTERVEEEWYRKTMLLALDEG